MEHEKAAPRAALFHDLSGLGRCALTVVIPVLGALGVQPCPLPTAVMSAHTEFDGIVARDETDFLESALLSWERMDRQFEGVYSGYLASARQAELIGRFMRGQRERYGARVIVDPAMADHGKMYRGLPAEMPRAMAALARSAELITPNPTEACLLTGQPYSERPACARRMEQLLNALLALGCQGALITGLPVEAGRCVNALADGRGRWMCAYDPLPMRFPGTGDLFSAVLTALVLTGHAPEMAMARATEFVYRAMRRTLDMATPPCEGVQFEGLLFELSQMEGFALECM